MSYLCVYNRFSLRLGYLWVFPGEGDFNIERGEDKLTIYEFANKTMGHKVRSPHL
jgi:hypothetical protein